MDGDITPTFDGAEDPKPLSEFGKTTDGWTYTGSELKNLNARFIGKMLRLRNYDSDPTEAAVEGDLAVVAGVLKICSVAGTPGTWTAVGAGATPSTTIARDGTSSASALSGGTNFTIPHTCAGTNRLLVVGIFGKAITTDILTSVTYNGATMTRFNAQINVGGHSMWVYYLLNPSTGANNIAITTSSDPGSGGGGGGLYAVAGSYTGVFQGGFPENSFISANPSSSAAAFSTGVAPTNPYEWGIIFLAGDKNPLSLQAASGNGSVTVIPVATTYIFLADTDGTISPPTVLTTGVQQSSAGTQIFYELFIEHA